MSRMSKTAVLALAALAGPLATALPATATSYGSIRVTIVNDAGNLIHIDDRNQVCPIDPAHPSRVNSTHTATSVGHCGTVQDGVAVLTSVLPGRWQLRLYRGVGKGPCYNANAAASPCNLVRVWAGTTSNRRFDPWARTARVILDNTVGTLLRFHLSNPDPIGTWTLAAKSTRVITYTTHDPAEDYGGDEMNISEPDHPGCGYGDEGSHFQPRHTYRFAMVVDAAAAVCRDANGGSGYNIGPRITQTG